MLEDAGECIEESDCPKGYTCNDGRCMPSGLTDTTAPETIITSGPQAETTETTATFYFTCNEEPCSYECRIDGGAWGICTSPATYTGLGTGQHTFEVRASDEAGNTDPTPSSCTWSVISGGGGGGSGGGSNDTTPPETYITTANTGMSATFAFECDEQNCSCECKLDSGVWESCTSPVKYSGLYPGSHTFEVRAIDGAGNADSTPAMHTWEVVRTWDEISAGGEHTCAIGSDTSLWCWGRNNYGQVGDGSREDRTEPVYISDGWQMVSSGGYHTCGIKTDGTLWCWGRNDYGQLGDGTFTNRSVPVQVGQDTWNEVSAGALHTCGIKSDSSSLCWGDNYYGQLGDWTTWKEVPIYVP